MKVCFHSVANPFVLFPQFNSNKCTWNPNSTTPIFIQNYSVNSRRVKSHHRFHLSIRVLEHGKGVLSPANDDTDISVESQSPDTSDGVLPELVDVAEEDHISAPKNLSPKRFAKKKEKDDDDEDGRFNLRNGREVCFSIFLHGFPEKYPSIHSNQESEKF